VKITENTHRPFWASLVFEKDGDLNLTWLFVMLMGIIGSVGFVHATIIGHNISIVEKIAAWSFLGATLTSMLIAAIPLSKAKVLANATLPGEIAKDISSMASIKVSDASTDLKEQYDKLNKTTKDIG
jgi:uncharacterized membrane protein